MDLQADYYLTSGDCQCAEHGRRADFVLKLDYGGIIIPMCQECIDELYEVILPQVSAEVLTKNAQG